MHWSFRAQQELEEIRLWRHLPPYPIMQAKATQATASVNAGRVNVTYNTATHCGVAESLQNDPYTTDKPVITAKIHPMIHCHCSIIDSVNQKLREKVNLSPPNVYNRWDRNLFLTLLNEEVRYIMVDQVYVRT